MEEEPVQCCLICSWFVPVPVLIVKQAGLQSCKQVVAPSSAAAAVEEMPAAAADGKLCSSAVHSLIPLTLGRAT